MIPEARSITYLLRGQAQHWVFLSLLLIPVLVATVTLARSGAFLGVDLWIWYAIAIVMPVVHQVLVWAVWRAELGWAAVSPLFGGRGFKAYAGGFAVCILSRPVAILGLGLADMGTVPIPWEVAITIGGALALPAAYTMYSVERYFGFTRAIGADHFDEAYRHMPFVRKGIFRYSTNAMYLFGFFALWAIAISTRSQLALVAVAYQHIYIWVHFLYTERPDLELIYGQTTGPALDRS